MSGVGTANITLYDAQTTTLTATLSTVHGTSTSFTVAPLAASAFTIGTIANQAAGTPFNVTITAVDTYGNTATTYASPQTVTFSGPASSPNGTAPLYPTGTISFTAGVGTASVSLYDAQTTTLTATQSSLTGTSNSFTVAGGTAASETLSTPPGTSTAGVAVAGPPAISVEDTYGNPVTGATVTVTVASGPGAFTSGSTKSVATVATGIASFTNLVLDTAGAYTLTFTAGALPTVTSASFTVNPANATAFTVSNPGSPTAGTPFTLTITEVDSFGNTVTTYTGSQTITFSGPSSSPGPVVTAPSYPASVTFASGVGTATITLYDAQSTTLTATQSTIHGTSTSFTVTPSTATAFKIATIANPTAGNAFNVTITAIDSYGNTATTYTGSQTISFSGPSSSPGPVVTAPLYPPSVTFTNGVGTASVTLYDAQSTTLTAAQTPMTATSNSFTVAAGATSLFKIGTIANQNEGTAFNVTLNATDAYGNATTSYTGSKTITFTGPSSSPGGTAPTYPGTVFFSSGAGTASVTFYDAQTTTLTATQGTITGTSNSFTVAAGTASAFSVANPGSQAAGTPFTVTVTEVDNHGNTVTTYAGSETITFSGPSSSPGPVVTAPSYPASVTFASGVGTASITLYDAQSTTLTATQSTIHGTSTSFTVAPSTATAFKIATIANPTAGTAFNVTITAIDAYGNTATGYTGSQAISFSGPSSSPGPPVTAPLYPASVTFTAGVGTASITLYDAQTTTLTAAQTPLTATSNSFTVAVGATTTFKIGTIATQTAGTAFSVTLTAYDSYGNATTGYAGTKTVTFTGPASSPGGNAPTYPGTVSFSVGVGTASITLYNASSTTTLTATQGSATGTSTTFTVNPSATVAALTFTPQPTGFTAGGSTSVVVTAKDAYGNVATTATSSVNLTQTSGPTATFTGFGAVALSTGTATFTISTTTAGTYTITAHDGSINSAASSSFTVAPGTINGFTVATIANQTAGHRLQRHHHRRRPLRQYRHDLRQLPGDRVLGAIVEPELHLARLPVDRHLLEWHWDGLHHAVRRPEHDAHGHTGLSYRHLEHLQRCPVGGERLLVHPHPRPDGGYRLQRHHHRRRRVRATWPPATAAPRSSSSAAPLEPERHRPEFPGVDGVLRRRR